ncbi:hypothetical protein RII68_003575 [Vibrio parahaemolyticus]|uniref:hypothetical protein n=3 Tax=Vibrio parahaemolyticus TaxID=670 RepID=UPI0007A043B5|nr:hypothetical protein [Vibrio parahaemolyticus]EGR1768229.1 hypothetical protein [Vibrio parahaemolyticus]EIO3966867.1 hypothetical protein [Vibrio parahaemolyticus]EIO3989734.1 hypothetical protein [Vibrio parahaemolyticus]ELA9842171.1 hypothetical protein [Vibrio parahaemolyticus]ELC0707162.1 hypothetical protein [Vibrio parahaemolyticus]
MQEIIKKLRESRDKSELLRIRIELDNQLKQLEQQKSQIEEDYVQLEADKIEVAKYVEFNSQSYASFYNTKLEKDKSILTLSVAGLGFLITFTNFAEKLGTFAYIAFLLAALAYLFCVFNVITIFEKNALYIIEVTTDSDKVGELEVQLRKHDKRAIYSFYLGILLSFVLGISTSVQSQLKGQEMSDSNNNKAGQTTSVQFNDSFAGLAKINESFSGLSAMKPKPSKTNQSAQNTTAKTSNTENKRNG